jgi:hypothetical protein
MDLVGYIETGWVCSPFLSYRLVLSSVLFVDVSDVGRLRLVLFVGW